MLKTARLSDLVARLDQNDTVSLNEVLAVLRADYPIANHAYLDVSTLRGNLRVHRLHHSFPAAWAHSYVTCQFHRIDPVLLQVSRGVVPVDWANAGKRATAASARAFLRAARRHGIGSEGIAFPLISRLQRTVIMTLEATLSGDEWQRFRHAHLGELQLLAHLFHAAIEAERGVTASSDCAQSRACRYLTEREIEVVKWVAAGKSYWEIATILGISERTVRYFMTNVRQKLDVVSNSQAVARAVGERLVILG